MQTCADVSPVIVCLGKQLVRVSEEDFVYLNQWRWYLNSEGYAVRKEKKIVFFMHIEVAKRAGISIKNEVDHKDRNPRNCRRGNLRAATRSQNQANTSTHRDSTSLLKGVTWNKRCQKWQSQIKKNGRNINLGLFDSAIKAAKQYDFAARKLFGEFAFLNFPEER